MTTHYLQTVYFVENRVFPWKSWEREYFSTRELAERVSKFYFNNMDQVPGGIDTSVGEEQSSVVNTEAGIRLREIGRQGTIYMVESKFDLEELTKKLLLLGKWAQEQMESRTASPQLR